MAPYDTNTSLAYAVAPVDAPAEPVELLETRFGTLTIKPAHKLEMPRGPFGFSDYTQFALADVPNQPASQFRILQSLEDREVSFIVLPAAADNEWIGTADFEAACANYCFDPATSGLLLIATMRRERSRHRTPAGAPGRVHFRRLHDPSSAGALTPATGLRRRPMAKGRRRRSFLGHRGKQEQERAATWVAALSLFRPRHPTECGDYDGANAPSRSKLGTRTRAIALRRWPSSSAVNAASGRGSPFTFTLPWLSAKRACARATAPS